MIYSAVGAGNLDYAQSPPEMGIPTAFTNYPGAELALNADVEPDVDGDGFGDETQDLCTAQPGLQSACSPPQFLSKKFKRGVGFVFTLSEPATVSVVVNRLNPGRVKSGKCSLRAKRGKRCVISRKLKSIAGLLAPSGSSTIPYSIAKLRRGAYEAVLMAVNSGAETASTKIDFTVK